MFKTLIPIMIGKKTKKEEENEKIMIQVYDAKKDIKENLKDPKNVKRLIKNMLIDITKEE